MFVYKFNVLEKLKENGYNTTKLRKKIVRRKCHTIAEMWGYCRDYCFRKDMWFIRYATRGYNSIYKGYKRV